MFETTTLMLLIPGLPLLATLVTAALGRNVLRGLSHWPVLAGVAGAFVASALLLADVRERAAAGDPTGYPVTHTVWNWVSIDDALGGNDFTIGVTLQADALSAIMLTMVTFVATLVVIYAIGYMRGDPGYWRFFTYVALFVFSMTMLVSVANFVLLYVFWEAVGVCSYLLIGFWFEKPEAAAAGKKAFLVNRVGDFGFALGVFLIWMACGTLDFAGVFGGDHALSAGMATAICLCLMLGACGKSAQFPLHVWLPDAMEGPTPVSALIHAATMVTAGVYMVTRCTPLFAASPDAQVVVSCIGGFTAMLAAIIALTQTDLKRVMAYSTVSQLGYMFLGLGTGSLLGVTAAMFHLFTHAFFKALLFLGSGSVMHAMGGVIDMRRFGGLRRLMPITHLTFLVGCLALAGVFPLAGFFSKDAIIEAVHGRQHGSHGGVFTWLYYGSLLTAGMTAFYTFRAFFKTFHGPERIPHEAGHHAHESPPSMTVPLVVLAVCAATVGWACQGPFADLLRRTPGLASLPAAEEHAAHPPIAEISTVIALAGIGMAAFLYLGGTREVDFLTRTFEGLRRDAWGRWVLAPARCVYQLSHGKFFCDAIYMTLIVWPLRALAWFCYTLDRWLVDGLVNLCGRIPATIGMAFRSLQNGLVQFYGLAMVLGLLVLIATLAWS